MARTLTWIGLAVLGFSLTGCVSLDQYGALKLERDSLAAQFTHAQTEIGALQAENEALKGNANALANNTTGQNALLTNLQARLAAAEAARDDAMAKYEQAMRDAPNRAGALPQALTNTLSEFARQNSDLVDFDAARGIVKFKSDLTFATGKSELTPQARDAIQRFSAILNSAAAAQYELVVAGHTDNTRVVNPETIRAGNLDNWYLSSHRAISVTESMIQDGVNAQRIGATGFADCRPAASNATSDGKAKNRRVEVLILPNAIHAQMAGDHISPTRHTGPAHANKDDVVIPSGGSVGPNK